MNTNQNHKDSIRGGNDMDTAADILKAIREASKPGGDPAMVERLLADDDFWEVHDKRIEDEEQRERDDKRAVWESIKARRWASIPAEYRENFDITKTQIPDEVISYCRQWKPSVGKGIGLTGKSGAGKTRLLVAMLKVLKCSWMFLPATTFADSVRKQYDDDFGVASRASKTLEDAKIARVLLLDDLGWENPTESVMAEMADMIEHRMSRKMPILWTSNKTGDELQQHYGKRGAAIVRRLKEFSWMP